MKYRDQRKGELVEKRDKRELKKAYFEIIKNIKREIKDDIAAMTQKRETIF